MGKRFLANLVVSTFILLVSVGFVYSVPATSNADFEAEQRYVPVIAQQDLLSLQVQGAGIIYVDAREDQEFNEERIPGAINITLREIDKYKSLLQNSNNIVVAYCLKDFRGYEVAKALKQNGIANVYTMAMPGLNGWKSRKLPTEGKRVSQK